MTEDVRGYLVVKVMEAAGHNGEDVKVWDDSLKEAFVKSEICEFHAGNPHPFVFTTYFC